MRLRFGWWLAIAVFATLFTAHLLTSFERPPVVSVQRGFRGTAMELVYNPRLLEVNAFLHQVPQASEAADADGPKAKDTYENVQVLGELSVQQFGRIMQAMTEWVAPETDAPTEPGTLPRGCNYCHNPENYAQDWPYTKVVSRRMLQMVKHINEHWQSHVGEAGVTCHTCHRGNPVPANNWAEQPTPDRRRGTGFTADSARQNLASPSVGLASLPYDVFTPFLKESGDIRIAGRTALPTDEHRDSIKQTEWTYGLMMHFSQSLNANCTHCHNSRQFSDWNQSSPQRLGAWHGIRMTRAVNVNYIEPLRPVFPANRVGPMGDPLKVNCATCHQGAYKPFNGAHMLDDYPELNRAASTPAPSAEARR